MKEYHERGPIWTMATSFPIEEMYTALKYAAIPVAVAGPLIISAVIYEMKVKKKHNECMEILDRITDINESTLADTERLRSFYNNETEFLKETSESLKRTEEKCKGILEDLQEIKKIRGISED